jgi:hypothetical protein
MITDCSAELIQFMRINPIRNARGLFARTLKCRLNGRFWNTTLAYEQLDLANLEEMIVEFNQQNSSRISNTNDPDVRLERELASGYRVNGKKRNAKKVLGRITMEFMCAIKRQYQAGRKGERDRVTGMRELQRRVVDIVTTTRKQIV